MEFTQDMLEDIKVYGRYDYSPRQMAIMMELTGAQEKALADQMRDPDSPVRRAYEKGQLTARQETIEHLEATVEKGEEGAGDAAKAIAYLRHRNREDELKKDLFGV